LRDKDQPKRWLMYQHDDDASIEAVAQVETQAKTNQDGPKEKEASVEKSDNSHLLGGGALRWQWWEL
jgi:hypothetical protein